MVGALKDIPVVGDLDVRKGSGVEGVGPLEILNVVGGWKCLFSAGGWKGSDTGESIPVVKGLTLIGGRKVLAWKGLAVVGGKKALSVDGNEKGVVGEGWNGLVVEATWKGESVVGSWEELPILDS